MLGDTGLRSSRWASSDVSASLFFLLFLPVVFLLIVRPLPVNDSSIVNLSSSSTIKAMVVAGSFLFTGVGYLHYLARLSSSFSLFSFSTSALAIRVLCLKPPAAATTRLSNLSLFLSLRLTLIEPPLTGDEEADTEKVPSSSFFFRFEPLASDSGESALSSSSSSDS